MTAGDLEDAVTDAVRRVPDVRGVSTVHIGQELDGRPLVAIRIGVPPTFGLTDVVKVIARAQLAAGRVVPNGSAIFVEPDVAADQATPTDAIVVRGFD